MNTPTQKPSLPDDMQISIAVNELSKDELIEMLDTYTLSAEQLNLIGNSFRNLNEFALAEKSFSNAIELNPSYDEPYGNLISLYVAQKKFDQCEPIYRKGMDNAAKKSFIIYHDGRLAFIQGNFERSLMAARCILIDEQLQEESAFVLGVHSLLSLAQQQKDVDKNILEAYNLWKDGISLFPNSKELNELGYYFDVDAAP